MHRLTASDEPHAPSNDPSNKIRGANPERIGRSYAAAFAFFALRASRYFRILLFATSRCFPHTIPNTGAAGFLQPGTGQS